VSEARLLESARPTCDSDPAQVDFGGLRVPTSAAVIQPRSWTVAQSTWAAELAPVCPPGPVLELFAGSGHIGLEASRRTGRSVVLVDLSAEACRLATETARVNGLDASVVNAGVSRDLCERTRPGLVLADPPYVPESEVGRFPSDPIDAIDGGPDGLSLVRAVLLAVHPALSPNVPLILQLRGLGQAAMVDRWLEARNALGMRIDEVRCFGTDRALVLIRSRG
jgi:methylase of polypeptide subunit release factors